MPAAPRLLSVATAVPRYPLHQDDVIKRVKLLFGGAQVLVRLLPVFGNTGIARRYSCVPIEWYKAPHGWPERNAALSRPPRSTCSKPAAPRARPRRPGGGEIDAIVVVSTTGIATPSLDAL